MCFSKPTPPVTSSPIVDQAKIDADAAAKASQDRIATSRRRRSSGTLLTSGGGDTSALDVAAPAAKPTLGA